LRDITDAGPIPEVAQGRAEQAYSPTLMRKQAEQRTDQGGLSGTIASHQGNGLSGAYGDRDAAQHRKPAQFNRKVLSGQDSVCF